MVAKLLQRPAIRYLMVGGSVYLAELLIIVLGERAELSPVLVVTISFTVGTVLGFLLQKFVTFGDYRTHHRLIIAQMIAIGLLLLWNLLFTLLLTAALESIVPTTVIRTIAIVITTFWNYYLYRTRIFNHGN